MKKQAYKPQTYRGKELKPVPVVEIVAAMLLIGMIIWGLDHFGIIQFTNVRPE